jgi:L-alanine-DL-glutamate epimerase-like enolase superfamily enzyme
MFFGVEAAEAHIHSLIAPYLIDQDPCLVSRHWPNLMGYVGFHGSSAEQRGRSAVDIALWDLWARPPISLSMPCSAVLCATTSASTTPDAGNRYALNNPVHNSANFGVDAASADPYEDLDGFLHRADELAHSLLEMDITGMKIWPFDFVAEPCNGTYISAADLDKALTPFRKIRDAVGDRMDVMAELHGLWNVPAGREVIAALEPYKPLWIEDPVFMDQLDSLGQAQASTKVQIATGETLAGRPGAVQGIAGESGLWCRHHGSHLVWRHQRSTAYLGPRRSCPHVGSLP